MKIETKFTMMSHFKFALTLFACAFVGYFLGLGLARLS